MKKLILLFLVLIANIAIGQTYKTSDGKDIYLVLGDSPRPFSTGTAAVEKKNVWSWDDENSAPSKKPVIIDGHIYESAPNKRIAFTEEEEYDTANYFAVYLAIQTSNVTKAQTKMVKEMTLLVKKNGGVMYAVIQSGVPPTPCGGPSQPKCQ